MKSSFAQRAVGVLPVIALIVLVACSVNLAVTAGRYRVVATGYQPGPGILGNSCDNLMHQLYATSGR